MGLSVEDLADLAYRFALGGIDLIKDDHGLADQRFCRFEDRVQPLCGGRRASESGNGPALPVRPQRDCRTGGDCPPGDVCQGLCGAGGLLVSPGLCGFEAMRPTGRR